MAKYGNMWAYIRNHIQEIHGYHSQSSNCKFARFWARIKDFQELTRPICRPGLVQG